MAEYQLSEAAAEHITDIADYTDTSFGDNQTEAYLTGLKASFTLIAQFPRIGVAVFEIKQGWRRHKYQKHYVFYSEQPGYVLIEAVVHTGRQIRPELFE